MSHHIVESREVHFLYPDGTKALDGISFRIVHGESVALIGENGAGKSTLLMHLNGYLTPSNGELIIGDYPITKKTLQAVRRAVGFVFQDPDDQLFMPTVYDDVAFGPLNMDLPLENIRQRVKDALEQVGALHLIDRPPYKLSGGEKRIVTIASILSMTPDILVMDEPTSNLDPRARRKIISILKTFMHTKIIATHDLDMALDVCERTLIIYDGRIVADDATDILLRDEELLFKYGLEKPLGLQKCPVCSRTVL
jgi:cobalt/nickel transport system ATP-binding protein